MNTTVLAKAANEARGLAIDAVAACSSGHLGLPLGCAEIGAALFGETLRYNPAVPRWLNRDRFILSAGHGSMFLYSWLHLAGYAVSREDLGKFRVLHSITPGHPEFRETPGVEATTGPLGQGIGNAVGFAISGKKAAARFNTAEHTIFDHHVIALHGDGCFEEGVGREAIAFAGHNGLDNLILIYDCNGVTLDAMASVTQGPDAESYFLSQDWDVIKVDGQDMAQVAAAVERAKADDNGRPKVILAKTLIGKGIPEVAGTPKAHGEGGAKFAASARAGLGLPADEKFYVSQDVLDYFAGHRAALEKEYAAWNETFAAWSAANPALAAELADAVAGKVPANLRADIARFPAGYKEATRSAGDVVINEIAKVMPDLVTGAADLYGSTKNYITGGGDFSATNATGRNFWFGIREHAMGAITNGLAYDGIFRPSCATFLVFADYMRGAIRVASLAQLPVTYIYTHDSVGVGEDGPTHQPVETVSGLRVMPHLDVIRPADGEETAGAWEAAIERTDGPTALILTRQGLPAMDFLSADERRDGVARGGYIVRREKGKLDTILLSCGSELQHALAAAAELGDGVRVVSMPCFGRFDRQDAGYRESVLPAACTRRVAIEAGVSALWWKYTGDAGRVIGIDRFGMSGAAPLVMAELGMTSANVVAAARSLGA